MKVILLRDVAKIGRKGSVVEVPDGFALNRLLPKKDAVAATAASLRQHAALVSQAEGQKKARLAEVSQQAATLTATPLVITKVANEQGHLFESIHVADIVTVASVRGVMLDPSTLVVPVIKAVGEHSIEIVAGTSRHTVPIIVVAK